MRSPDSPREGDLQFVGTVKEIHRYPVKSMRGEILPEAEISWHGIEGDRRHAFVKQDHPTGFPWLTGRDLPEMLLYTPRIVDPANINESAVMVKAPSGAEVSLDSPSLLMELMARWGSPIQLMHLKKGCHDAMPLSFLSTATVAALGQQVGLDLAPSRFRPNVLVELVDGGTFGEDNWLGSTIRIGEGRNSARVRIDRRNKRCVMTNIDPDTAERDPRVLGALIRMRDECAAVYGSAELPGTIRAGDPIYRWTA